MAGRFISVTRIFHRSCPRLSIPSSSRTMSLKGAISKLNSPVKDLVVTVTNDGAQYDGETAKDQADVAIWIEKASRDDLVKEENLPALNALLVPRTYIAVNYFTAADVALYGALHPMFSRLQASQHYSLPSITRYFDHIQSFPPVRKSADSLSPSFDVVSFDLDNAPKQNRTAEPPRKKEKAKPAAIEPLAEKVSEKTAAPTEPAPAAAEKGQKKEKKEKKTDTAGSGSKDQKGGKAAPVDDGEPVPSMIDLRVGHIVDIMKHPDADGLYVEQIDIGEETGPRTVVSGLVNYIPIDQMRDKYLVVVCNLKPANMRGVKSFAMVLCATSKDGKDGGIELIQPPANSKPGDRVYFEGGDFEGATPLAQLNPKKKIFETVQPDFITLESKEAAWVNPLTKSIHRFRTKEGVCIAPTLIGASLS